MVINDLGAGGAQRAVLEQARVLDPARFEVEIASLEIKPGETWAATTSPRVPVHLPGMRGLVPYLREFRPHIVHAHLVAASVASVVAARAAGQPRVLATFHNITDWEEKRSHPVRVLGRALLHDCGALIAVSEAVREAILRVSPDLAERSTVIYNGTDLTPFADVRRGHAAARALLGYDSGAFVVGGVARLDPRKGLDLLLQAAALTLDHLPGLQVVIVGDGPERGRLESLARVLGLEARVRFVGEQRDVRPYLAALDLFAAPSRTEGMGLAIVEALAAGVPVAAARVGGIPEVLQNGTAGWLVDGADPRAWAQAIARAAALPGERQRLSLVGPARARVFAIEITRRRLEAVYDRLLGRETVVPLERAA
jgi:glycosyltransferase involved in cell wall biosynthesis